MPVVVKVRSPLAVSRSSNSTSDGELSRAGTCGVGNIGGPLVRPTSKILGEYAVNLDPHLAHAAKRDAACQQAGESRAGD